MKTEAFVYLDEIVVTTDSGILTSDDSKYRYGSVGSIERSYSANPRGTLASVFF